jgi:copper homeostasis protein
MNDLKLEIAANSVASAEAAQGGGAARVELCAALEVGGLTPSHATIAIARERLDIDLYVLIRPRAGDFTYQESEIETMRRDVETCADLGCDGVIIGALTAEQRVDTNACSALVAAARGMGVTFHRAFDMTADPRQALTDVIDLRCERLLTSGARPTARDGAPLIRELIEQADHRLIVMPGAGIDSRNIAALAHATGAREFHASAKRMLPSPVNPTTELTDMSTGELRSDENEVRALVAALHGERTMPWPPDAAR